MTRFEWVPTAGWEGRRWDVQECVRGVWVHRGRVIVWRHDKMRTRVEACVASFRKKGKATALDLKVLRDGFGSLRDGAEALVGAIAKEKKR